MTIANLLSEIDAEIARLQQARALLAGHSTGAKMGRKAGAAKTNSAVAVPKRKKRHMSPEGRARIAAAQKARWAAQKKAAAKPAKKAPAKKATKKSAAKKAAPKKTAVPAPTEAASS